MSECSIDLPLLWQGRELFILLFAPLTRFLVNCLPLLACGSASGSLLAVARVERGAREGEGYPGRAGLVYVLSRIVFHGAHTRPVASWQTTWTLLAPTGITTE